MNKSSGIIAGLAVALAFIRVISTPTAPMRSSYTPPEHDIEKTDKHAAAQPGRFIRGCAAFSMPTRDPSTGYPEQHEYGTALSTIGDFVRGPSPNSGSATPGPTVFFTLLKQSPLMHYAVVLAPNPLRTQLGVIFDREMSVVQQAAGDEGYVYNSSWLPWTTVNQSFETLGDTQLNNKLLEDRANCPGILLFRNRNANSALDVYRSGLIILVVGEEPTGGIDQGQWDNAIAFLTKAVPLHGFSTLHILGPTFSGSAASTIRDIESLPRSTFQHVQILSGTVSDCGVVGWMQQKAAAAVPPVPLTFGTFQESDEVHIARFMKLLASQKIYARETAILSEDETEYGIGDNDSCRPHYTDDNQPLRLFYPRDMSAVRFEYQKQGLFNPPEHASPHSHIVLSGAPESSIANSPSDTIQSYAQTITPLAEEAELYGVVNELRAHHTRVLLLRCTNPLDYLFLTRFFHRTYPAGRIVILGQDLLLRREMDTTEFRGVLSLSSYPLLPRDQHWTALLSDGYSDSHLIFESNLMQGIYIAGRYSFDPRSEIRGGITTPGATLTLNRKSQLAGYADPFWLHKPTTTQETGGAPAVPPTWVSVLGRDGFWPVAVLSPATVSALPIPKSVPAVPEVPASIMVRLTNEHNLHYDLSKQSETNNVFQRLIRPLLLRLPRAWRLTALLNNRGPSFNRRLLFSLPIAWQIAALVTVGLLIYQIYGTARYGSRPSGGLFSVFQEDPSALQSILFALSAGIVCAALLSIGAVRIVLPSLRMLTQTPWIYFSSFIAPLAAIIVLGVLLLRRSSIAFCCFSAVVTIFAAVGLTFRHGLERNEAIALPLFYRMGHLTSGVSPLLPLLLLIGGAYLACWQAAAGNLLFGIGRPRLPPLPPEFVRLSDRMAKSIESTARPLAFNVATTIPPLLVGVSLGIVYWNDFPILSLEGYLYTRFINILLLIGFMLIVADGGRLFWTWTELRRLLNALNRLPLRRTLSHLHPIPSTSLWSVAGSVQRIQYQFFSAQIDAARRLILLCQSRHGWSETRGYRHIGIAYEYSCEFIEKNAVIFDDGHRVKPKIVPFLRIPLNLLRFVARWKRLWRKTKRDKYRRKFVQRHRASPDIGPRWDMAIAPKGMVFRRIRTVMATAVSEVMNSILQPIWEHEPNSLNLELGSTHTEELPLSDDKVVATAEEFVSLHYVSYIQNVLARMRTMVLSMIFLFVSICLTVSFYPFIPRTQVTICMIVVLFFISAVVIYVYAGMERDATLSYITNTEPGHLSGEFWIKTIGFLSGPVLGVLATQFPAISDSVLGLLQPGLDSMR